MRIWCWLSPVQMPCMVPAGCRKKPRFLGGASRSMKRSYFTQNQWLLLFFEFWLWFILIPSVCVCVCVCLSVSLSLSGFCSWILDMKLIVIWCSCHSQNVLGVFRPLHICPVEGSYPPISLVRNPASLLSGKSKYYPHYEAYPPLELSSLS